MPIFLLAKFSDQAASKMIRRDDAAHGGSGHWRGDTIDGSCVLAAALVHLIAIRVRALNLVPAVHEPFFELLSLVGKSILGYNRVPHQCVRYGAQQISGDVPAHFAVALSVFGRRETWLSERCTWWRCLSRQRGAGLRQRGKGGCSSSSKAIASLAVKPCFQSCNC